MNLTRPELYSLYELLTNRLFEIPDYQRTYSWGKKQRVDLFSDILKIKEKDREHFMATIVCLNKSKKQIGGSRFDKLDLVDGQQRLTTLIILLKSVCLSLQNGTENEKIIADDLQNLLVKQRDETVILLQTNHDTSSIFSNYLRTGIKPNELDLAISADKNLKDAFTECEKFVVSYGQKFGLANLYQTLMDKLKFILHTVEDEGVVYTVFEVLNSRGLDVDWLDKCKSLLLGIVFENTIDKDQIESTMSELHTIWSNIYRTIGLNEIPGDEIIRFSASLLTTVHLSKTYSAQEALDFFKDYCNSNIRRVIECSNWLLKVAKELLKLSRNLFLNPVTKVQHARLLKVSIELRDDLLVSEQDELIALWEKVTFRIFGIAGKDTRTKIGDYVRLSQSIVRKKQFINNRLIAFPKNEISLTLTNLGADFKILDVIKEIQDKDLYSVNDWKEELRYFFYKYERYLNAKKGYSFPDVIWYEIWKADLNKTIEHIYPQTPGSRWSFTLSTKDINRLGNITMLTADLNNEARNLAFNNKKDVYNKENRLLGLMEIYNNDVWNLEAIEKREQELINWAIATWD